jgi:hypothetical protein
VDIEEHPEGVKGIIRICIEKKEENASCVQDLSATAKSIGQKGDIKNLFSSDSRNRICIVIIGPVFYLNQRSVVIRGFQEGEISRL